MVKTEKLEVPCCHHDHALEARNHDKPYTCDGCKTESSGLRYRCEQCNFDLHEECTFTIHAETSSHDFFRGSKFRFLQKPPKNKKKCKNNCKDGCASTSCEDCQTFCNGCGGVDGFVYHCDKKKKKDDLDLHPRCFELKKTLAEFRLRDKVKGKCFWCGEKELAGSFSYVPGWSYVSKCGECHFHVHCATEMVMDLWKSQIGCDGTNCLTLEKVDMARVVANRRINDRGRKSTKFLKIVRVFMRAFACILFGEPTTVLLCLLTELIVN